jgi:hypothetical protein
LHSTSLQLSSWLSGGIVGRRKPPGDSLVIHLRSRGGDCAQQQFPRTVRWSIFRLRLVFALDRKLFPGLRHLLQSILVIWLSHQLCQFAAFVRIYSVFDHGAHGTLAWERSFYFSL